MHWFIGIIIGGAAGYLYLPDDWKTFLFITVTYIAGMIVGASWKF